MAIVKAAEKVVAKARRIAAHLLEASEDDLQFEGGTFSVRGTGAGRTIQEIAFAAFMAHDYPEGMEPSLDSDAVFDPENFSYPHGTHLAAMEVDTETGKVTLRRYVCVDDVGTVVNPLIVEGQVHGGLAQGIAQALYEEATYDESGTLVTGTLVDYTLPSAADLPSFDTAVVSTPATSNPLGVKGVGEAGTIASTPAIVNGVLDAVRHLGVTDIEMPTTAQRVWRALQAAGARGTQDTPTGSIDPNNPRGEAL
jgi:carbon-monoxide dehydrogenase large subunit